ncbi:MAG TPA: divalent metal cation transporter [Sandaracinaceae bacterium]
MGSTARDLWRALGPGVLFTGAAVGVSHLVQSTRAGASYGFALAGLVVLANLTKFPAFRFGPLYAVATGTSLLEGYRRQGTWALAVYAIMTVGTMFTVAAAVTLVTAGLAKALFGLPWSPFAISAGLLGVCAALLASGGYRWLDRAGKAIVGVLAVSTVAATVMALPRIDFGAARWVPSASMFGPRDVAFMAALVGWMPSAIDVAVWQSLWTLARRDETGHRPSGHDSAFDFYLGYLGTAFLALCFVALGAAVLGGARIEEAPGRFAEQVIDVYAQTLGAWSRPIIGAAAFATMFSTTLTVVDGFPRALSVLVDRFREPERDDPAVRRVDRSARYWTSLVVLVLGAMAILALLTRTMPALIDLATTLSFLSAPVLSWLNHRAVLAPEIPEEHRPRPWLIATSWAGIVFQSLFALYFLHLQLAG